MIRDQVNRGVTIMLPGADASASARRWPGGFGLPFWQFALSATDANRFMLRRARRDEPPKVVVHNWCYHGSVDETFAIAEPAGRHPTSNIGPAVEPGVTSRRWSRSTTGGASRRAGQGRRRRGACSSPR